MRATCLRVGLVLAVVTLVAVGLVVRASWNSFPGALVKNRLGLGGDALLRAVERRDELVARRGGRRPAEVRILVEKEARRLTLICDGEAWFACPIGLGGAPQGHKAVEGDGRTPEGDYYVCTMNERSKFHLFLGLSYPGRDDAERGLREGLVTRQHHDAIIEAVGAGRRPPWDTPLGGAVGIHGCGSGADWTRGCIAVDDDAIELLWGFCASGTRVTIRP